MPAWFHRSASSSRTATLAGFSMTLIGLDESCRGSAPLELCRDHPPCSLAHRPEIGVAAPPKAPNAPSKLVDIGIDDNPRAMARDHPVGIGRVGEQARFTRRRRLEHRKRKPLPARGMNEDVRAREETELLFPMARPGEDRLLLHAELDGAVFEHPSTAPPIRAHKDERNILGTCRRERGKKQVESLVARVKSPEEQKDPAATQLRP